MKTTGFDPALVGAVVSFEPADEPQPGAPARPDLPVERPAEPSAQAQEILFYPAALSAEAPGLRLFFETDQAELDHHLASTVESVFVLGGWSDVTEFGKALRATVTEELGALRPVPVQGESNYISPERTPKRHALVSRFPDVRQDLFTRIEAAERAIEPVAANWAVSTVREHRTLLVEQAFRYLLTGPSDRPYAPADRLSSIRRLLSSTPGGLGIDGPDAAALVGALRAVRAPRDALRELDAEIRNRTILRTVRSVVALAPASPAIAAVLPILELCAPAARADTIDARVALAAEVERLAADHPIVHRLWTTAAVDRVHAVATANPGFSDEAIARRLFADHAYRSAVGGALADTLTACDAMLDELKDASTVWRYPVVVERALAAHAVPAGSLTAAAAREKVAREAAEQSTIAAINEVVGYCELAALAGGVTAPVAAWLEVASLALGALEAVETTWHTWLQSQASRTHLNPAFALAGQPSYLGAILGILGAGASAAFGVKGLLK